MKILISQLLIFFLRKLGVSVALGLTVTDGEICGQNHLVFWYDNELNNTIAKSRDGIEFKMPTGKFKLQASMEAGK